MAIVNNAYEVERLKKVAQGIHGGALLDIGYAQLPNTYFRDVYKVGLDLNRPKNPSGYDEEIVGSATGLANALGTRQFDWIVAGEFIEHMRQPYDFLESLKPHLAESGKLILSTPNPVAWPTLFFEWARSERRFYTQDHLYYFAPRWVKRMLDHCGFDLLETRSVGLWGLPFVIPCPVALSYQVVYIASPRQHYDAGFSV